MPTFIGKSLCPDVIFIDANFPKYREMSKQFKSIMLQYDTEIESLGLDEGAIDVTDYLQKNGLDSEEGRIFLGQKIRREIQEET